MPCPTRKRALCVAGRGRSVGRWRLRPCADEFVGRGRHCRQPRDSRHIWGSGLPRVRACRRLERALEDRVIAGTLVTTKKKLAKLAAKPASARARSMSRPLGGHLPTPSLLLRPKQRAHSNQSLWGSTNPCKMVVGAEQVITEYRSKYIAINLT